MQGIREREILKRSKAKHLLIVILLNLLFLHMTQDLNHQTTPQINGQILADIQNPETQNPAKNKRGKIKGAGLLMGELGPMLERREFLKCSKREIKVKDLQLFRI